MSQRYGGDPAAGDSRRRGAVAVQVAVLMVAMCGFAAMSFDVGVMYNTKNELQRTADAAALGAAARLGAWDEGNPMALARAAAANLIK